MRLIRASVSNFKLLRDVKIDFSVDRQRPLTVIRAENGSGKTSLLYALGWALYGDRGLPEDARHRRLISTAVPVGAQVQVSASVEFERDADDGSVERYRLTRTVLETSRPDDTAERGPVTTKLLRLSQRGDEEYDVRLVERLLPPRLQHIFFTNGEEVETFIKGADATGRQRHVQDATRALLGLDEIEGISDDLRSLNKSLRQQAAGEGGQDHKQAAAALEVAERACDQKRAERIAVAEELSNLNDAIMEADKRLAGVQGIGSLDRINHDLARVERELEELRSARESQLTKLRVHLRTADFAFSVVGGRLQQGLNVLQGLADRRVIPGPSVEVLRDRLDMNLCICGESLSPDLADGARRREHVRMTVLEADMQSVAAMRMTELWHQSRMLSERRTEDVRSGNTLAAARVSIAAELATLRTRTQAANTERELLVAARDRIDDAVVRDLTSHLRRLRSQVESRQHDAGRLAAELASLEERMEQARGVYERAARASGRASRVTAQVEVCSDLQALAAGILKRLQERYVAEVARKMSEMFMRIVGSDPAFEGAVFAGVRIDPKNYQIIVDAQNQKTLDPKFEINGASQRALTLAFIWALTEVSRAVAPRIIDTPLGMVAGGVKTRMVDAITAPIAAGAPYYQVVLLLTRSEIAGIESLLDQRMGKWVTLSCSKDYPVDLRFKWDSCSPEVRGCACTHRKSCRVCARHYDQQSGVDFVDA
jgi:DNA sulfur modification protein DndD